jgi:hypothetical protein
LKKQGTVADLSSMDNDSSKVNAGILKFMQNQKPLNMNELEERDKGLNDAILGDDSPKEDSGGSSSVFGNLLGIAKKSEPLSISKDLPPPILGGPKHQ